MAASAMVAASQLMSERHTAVPKRQYHQVDNHSHFSSYAQKLAAAKNIKRKDLQGTPREIVLCCHGKEKTASFRGKDLLPYAELKALYFNAYQDLERLLDLEPTLPDFVEKEMPAFQLLDKEYDVYFEDFLSDDITEGSVISVDSSQIKTAEEIMAEKGPLSTTESNGACSSNEADALAACSEVIPTAGVPGGPGDSGFDRLASYSPTAPETIKAMGPVDSDLLIPGTTGAGLDTGTSDETAKLLLGRDNPSESPEGQEQSKIQPPKEKRVSTVGAEDEEDLMELPSNDFRARAKRLRRAVWTMMENPTSSNLGCIIMLTIVITIIFSTLVFVLNTIPPLANGYRDGPFDNWFIAETVTIAVFTLELLARALSFPGTQRQFWRDSFNVIDLVAIVPYYIEVVYNLVGSPVPVIFRMLRIIRIVRLIKLSKGSVSVFSKTMIASMNLLYMLLFMVFLITLICGSVIYYAERGSWNPVIGMYMRPAYYLCPVNVTSPEEMLSPAIDTTSNICTLSEAFPDGNMTYLCQYTFRKRTDCKLIREVSPYVSILHATWFVMQTITTVGFGDDTPTSALGKSLAAVVIMFGLLVVSLPITVIGAKFSRTYRNHQRKAALRQVASRFERLSFLQRFVQRLVYS